MCRHLSYTIGNTDLSNLHTLFVFYSSLHCDWISIMVPVKWSISIVGVNLKKKEKRKLACDKRWTLIKSVASNHRVFALAGKFRSPIQCDTGHSHYSSHLIIISSTQLLPQFPPSQGWQQHFRLLPSFHLPAAKSHWILGSLEKLWSCHCSSQVQGRLSVH